MNKQFCQKFTEVLKNKMNSAPAFNGLLGFDGFVDEIIDRMIFDGEKLSDLMAPLDLGWKERTKKERDLPRFFRCLVM